MQAASPIEELDSVNHKEQKMYRKENISVEKL